jgi:GTPase
MKFVDEVSIYVRSGKGGDGCASFLREKGNPFGGPNGGDGGNGGSVLLRAEPRYNTLLHLQYQQHHRAEHGQAGMSRQMYGRWGADLHVGVPVGTVVSDAETSELLADLDVAGAEVVVAGGGKGGRGNMHFKTSTNQAPKQKELGRDAAERRIRLTLKLIADVGLVGFPNAGKSTLISRISAAKPKIAEYPFTTLTPNLGIVSTDTGRSFCVADIPGLVEGASDGIGLGHRFLKHVERVSAFAVLLDVGAEASRHPVTDYEILMGELEAYSPEMLKKPRLIVLTKVDLPDTEAAIEDVEEMAKREGLPLFVISSVRGDGLNSLCYALQDLVDDGRAARLSESD